MRTTTAILYTVLMFLCFYEPDQFVVRAQNSLEDTIRLVFGNDSSSDKTDFSKNYKEVAPAPLESLEALKRCEENDDVQRYCVRYYDCDKETNTIRKRKLGDAVNEQASPLIDIRSKGDSSCDHYLEVCCKAPATSNRIEEYEPGTAEDRSSISGQQQQSLPSGNFPESGAASTSPNGYDNSNDYPPNLSPVQTQNQYGTNDQYGQTGTQDQFGTNDQIGNENQNQYSQSGTQNQYDQAGNKDQYGQNGAQDQYNANGVQNQYDPQNQYNSGTGQIETANQYNTNRPQTGYPSASSQQQYPSSNNYNTNSNNENNGGAVTTQSHCGVRNPSGVDFQITGNNDNEAQFAEFPWMVAILNRNYNTAQTAERLAICGGSVITPVVILTTAHCVLGLQPSAIKIRAGEWDTQTENEPIQHQERNVLGILTHDEYNGKTLANDVALLIIDRPLVKTASVGAICLPQVYQQFQPYTTCFATGWGKDVFGRQGRYSVILKKIELPLVGHDDCEESLRNTRLGRWFQLHESFLCAGGEEGKDTCTGDGGSPLVCEDPGNPGRYYQVGMVAWGIGCGQNDVPGVYVDVAHFRQWIDQKLDQYHLSKVAYSY